MILIRFIYLNFLVSQIIIIYVQDYIDIFDKSIFLLKLINLNLRTNESYTNVVCNIGYIKLYSWLILLKYNTFHALLMCIVCYHLLD